MNILLIIIGFSLLILGHELGHFTLAKLNGVKVEEFSLGMGTRLFTVKGKETEYSIRLLPIGGFVRMLGEQEESSDVRAFSNKSAIRRLSIIVAGPLMNFVLAILFFMIIAFSRGVVLPVIHEVSENTPAYEVGLKPGDKIVKINDKKVYSWSDLSVEISSSAGSPIKVQVNRSGETKDFNITPIKQEDRLIIGIVSTRVTDVTAAQAFNYGVNETRFIIKQTGYFFTNLFRGNINANDVGGPVTILRVSNETAKEGIIPLLNFYAFLSVQLAVFNLIPFPALDGGWVFLLLFEIITRKKADDKKVAIVNYIGLVVLMLLMVLVTIKDVLFPIKF